MEKEQAFKYLIDGNKDLGEFSKSILLLTNLKSNNRGIIDFKTFYGTNHIEVVSEIDKDSYFESYVGKIISKEKCTVLSIDESDLKGYVVEELEKSYDTEEDIEIILDNI